MTEFEDEVHPVSSRRTILSHKRQKFGKIQPIETHNEAVSTAKMESKIIPQLQEQRARLPIARGRSIHKVI